MSRKVDKPTEECPTATDDIKQAWAAQNDVRSRFVDAAEQGAEVRRIAAEFRSMRERNGFGRMIKKSMGLK